MRLLIVQYAGDYREAFHCLAEGQGETYYAQKYSVEAVAELCNYPMVEEVATLCCIVNNLNDQPYNQILPNGVRAIGAALPKGSSDFTQVLKLIEQQKPTHLVLRFPAPALLRWAIRHKIPTLLTLADSFSAKTLRNRVKNFLLARLLNHPQIQWVGNHGVSAAKSLQAIGVNPNKIIPWDWPHSLTPESFPAKNPWIDLDPETSLEQPLLALQKPPSDKESWSLIYIGSIAEMKGIGDAIEALKRLKAENCLVTLKIAGKGDEEEFFKQKVRELELENDVEFLGLVEHHKVVNLMREADLVLIPSRHEYPEGFPMTIYEALCSRTPIVASNHPMFLEQLKHNVSAMVFPATNSGALADCIKTVLANPELYQRLSQTASHTWQRLQIPVKWGDLVHRWIQNSPENQAWLYQQRLASGRYSKLNNRLVIVQYAGDYRQAVQDFAAGKEETYYAQKHSVDSVAKLSEYAEEVTVICCLTKEPYDEILPNGVRAIGAGFKQKIPPQELIQLIAKQKPTHLIARMATREIFDWAIRQKIRTIALFAASLSTKNLRDKIRNRFLVKALNHPQVEWVGSYGITSSLLLKQEGVNPEKIIPWDFLLEPTPGDLPPKVLSNQGEAKTVFYIGSMVESKGVGDILEAIARLRTKQIAVKLKIAGQDETGHFAAQAKQLKISECVEFLGIVPNKMVEPLMREADLVVVPSWHEYPEGFPLVIHHALRARTPIVASDHPMFKNNLKHRVSAMIFPAKNVTALSTCIETVLSDEKLYYSLSDASYETWQKLRLPVKWADILERWLNDSPEHQQWLSNHRLSQSNPLVELEKQPSKA